jgi:hypothetical protein
MSIAPVRASIPTAKVLVADGAGFGSAVGFAVRYQGSGWEKTHAGQIKGGGGVLTVETRRGDPLPTPHELRVLKDIVQRQRKKILSACRAVEGPWDEPTRKLAAKCFLIDPSGASPEQAAIIKGALSRMRNDTRGDITIQLMGDEEAAELEAKGIVFAPHSRILAHKDRLTVRDMLDGRLIFPGSVRLARGLLRKHPLSAEWTALHEATHRAGTADGPADAVKRSLAGYVDQEGYFRSGEIRFLELPKDPRIMLANADSYAAFITAHFDTSASASVSSRRGAAPRLKLRHLRHVR